MKGILSKIFGRKQEAPDGPSEREKEEAYEASLRRDPSDTEGGHVENANQEGAIDEESSEQEVIRRKSNRTWIGLDLDGTLARYDEWEGLEEIGAPIPLMVERLEKWLEEGHRVKIFTARASVEGGKEAVEAWLEKHNLPQLEVTCEKTFNMIEYWDDRAVQVIPNTGMMVLRPAYNTLPKAPTLDHESLGKTFVREADAIEEGGKLLDAEKKASSQAPE